MLILYDFEMTDESGNYDWIEEMGAEEEFCDYQYDPETHELYIQYYAYEESDSLLMHVFNYNLTQRPDFLTIRSGQDPEYIHDDLNNILSDLQNMVDYISGETDDQSNDIIQYDYIVEYVYEGYFYMKK
jgi:hypothetical protein